MTKTIAHEYELLWDDFVKKINNNKTRQQALKILKTSNNNYEFLKLASERCLHLLQSSDYTHLKTISSLLEVSDVTRSIIEPHHEFLFCYLRDQLSKVIDKNALLLYFKDLKIFHEVSCQIAKVILQVVQFLFESFSPYLQSKDGVYFQVFEMLMILFTSERFSKDCCLLCGTALALLYKNLIQTPHLIFHVKLMLNSLNPDCKVKNKNAEGFFLNSLIQDKVSSKFSYTSLCIGLLKSSGLLPLEMEKENGPLFLVMADQILYQCRTTKDAVAKYMSFQAFSSWLDWISICGFKCITKAIDDKMFLDKKSLYTIKILNLINDHIEDLVDGVSEIVKQIFKKYLNLQLQESSFYGYNNTFVYEIFGNLIQQPWHSKGRWVLLGDVMSYLKSEEVIQIYGNFTADFLKALSTCHLPPVMKDVFHNWLSLFRLESLSNKEKTEIWEVCLKEVIMKAICNSDCSVQQNLGQYILPTLLKKFGESVSLIENALEDPSNYYINSYMILLKSARKLGFISYKDLIKREKVIEDGLKHNDVDIRIETMNVLCYNSKTTEILPYQFQCLIKEFINDNLNCDSSKFRQQIFSCLKRLLINIRESCILIYRSNCKSKGTKNNGIPTELQQALEFVHSLVLSCRKCLSPTSMFQRRKTGLMLLNLLTDLFVYVENSSLRKKGAPTDAAKDFLKFVTSNESDVSIAWHVSGYFNNELLSCLEDQHDEVRELAYTILVNHEQQTNYSLLSDVNKCNEVLNISMNLMNSPKFHETESGAIILQLLAARFLNSKCEDTIDELKDCKLLNLCKNIQDEIYNDYVESQKDYFKAASEKPIFGFLLGISRCLKELNLHKLSVIYCNSSALVNFIKELIEFCTQFCSMLICLLAEGKWKKSDSLALISPSFAEIDKAMDVLLTSSNEYKKLSLNNELIKQNCREILISFCWLNLKSIANILQEIGHLCTINSDIIDEQSFHLICSIYQTLLIKCRHKGVIEASFSSLMEFTKNVSHIPNFWKILTDQSSDMLKNVTTMEMHASVTKRSAGIPMFIQSIISAENDSKSLFNETMNHLLDIASSPLPTVLNVTVDLPQFNAINILRAIFRDNKMSNKVLVYAEDGVILTIKGFSSPSWSIRNASTLLLGTLVTRMLGQHITQEKSSQQNASCVDVFFTWYPKLEDFFHQCLSEQANISNKYNILSHVIPVLTFLSKLKPSRNEVGKRLSKKFTPCLWVLLDSCIFTVRDMVSSSVLSFNIVDTVFIQTIFQDIHKTTSLTKIHSILLIISQLINNNDHVTEIYETIITELELLVKNEFWMNFGFMSNSILLDIVSQLIDKLELKFLYYSIHQFIKLLKQPICNVIAKPMYGKKLGELFVQMCVLLQASHLEDTGKVFDEISQLEWNDLHVSLFEESFARIEILSTHYIVWFNNLALKCIQSTCDDTNLLHSSIKFLAAKFFPMKNHLEIAKRLLSYVKRFPILQSDILPFLSKLLAYYIKNENIKELVIPLSNFIKDCSYSLIEDHRLAVAASISYILGRGIDLNQIKVTENPYKNHNISSAIVIFVESALKLIQDEDAEVRSTITKSLHFIYDDETVTTLRQANIVLKDFLKFIKKFFSEEKLYLEWLHTYTMQKLQVDSKVSNMENLMLFEQESDNLYAEEDEFILNLLHLIQEAYSEMVFEASQKQRIFDGYERLLQSIFYHIQYQDKTQKTLGLIKSIYGGYGNRQHLIPLIKLLTCIQICKFVDNTRSIDKNILGFLEVLDETCLPSSIVYHHLWKDIRLKT